jgi:PAS domain S-box-containing protein
MFLHAKVFTALELKSAIARAPLVVSPSAILTDAIALMGDAQSLCDNTQTANERLNDRHQEVRSSCVLVVENDQLVGILTDRDVVRLIAQQQSLEQVTVRQVMTHPGGTLRESAFTDPDVAMNLFRKHRVRHIAILDEGDHPVGLVTPDTLLAIEPQGEFQPDALQVGEQQEPFYQQWQEELSTRQQIEARLRESEKRYTTLITAAPVGIFRADALGNCIYVNDRWCQIAGLTPQAAMGNGWQQALHPDDRDRIVAEWSQSVQENRPLQLEYRLQRPDRQVTWVYGQAVAERDESGHIVGYVGTITDISDRIRSEAALQTSEAHHRALISAIPDLIARVNRAGIYLEFVATPNFRVVGNLPDAVGTHVSETLPPDLAQRRLDFIHLALQTRSIQIYEQDLSFGDVVQVEEVRVVPYSEDEVLLLVRDISDRKQAELALQHSEAKSRAILAAIPDLMFRVGVDEAYRGFVTQYRDFTVVPPAVDLTGQQMSEVLPPEHAERQRYYLQRALQTGELQIYEQTLHVGDRLQDEEVRVIKSDEDEVLFIIRDISDRKRAERQLQNLIEGTAATTGQNFFSALVSHIAVALDVSYAMVAEQVDGRLQVLAFWANGALQPTFSCQPVQTPCEQVLQDGKYYCHSCVQREFPNTSYLAEMRAESYLGLALHDTQGKAIGSLCILHHQPMRDPQQAENLLRVFAARAAAELERERATQALEQLNQELERKVEERTAALQASEERWQLVLKGSNDGIWDWDVTTNRVFYSSRWKTMRGFAENEISTSREEWAKGIHPDDYARVIAATNDHFARKTEFFEMEYRAQCKDGSYIWILDRGQALWNESGQVIRMSGSETDITARKQVEVALRASERRYATLAAVAPVAIFRFDAPLNCTYVSDRWSAMTGRPAESAMGHGWMNALHPEDRDRLVGNWSGGFTDMPSTNRVFNHGEGRHLRPDGSINWFYVQVAPEIDADGRIVGYIGTLTDITERKIAEEELEQSRDLLKAVFNELADALFLVDAETLRTLECNQRATQLFDVEDKADLLGIEGHQLQRTPFSHEELAEITADMQMNGCWSRELEYVTRRGRVFWGNIAAKPITVAGRSMNLVRITDISDRKQYEAQLHQTNEELARATRLKDEFLANMSHELRTPLNAILGMTEGLQDEVFGEVNERQLRALQTIERSGSHLLDLINDILDVAKIESGQLELESASVAVAPLCQSSLTFIKQQAQKKNIQLDLKLPSDLPNLLVDERRIRQVLINLLNNAVKFTPDGGRVTLEARPLRLSTNSDGATGLPQAMVQIAITDTGIGIAPEHIGRLFQPFIQIDSALNRKYQGTGLGLALVKRIVELHGGQVGLTSELGVGSCFTIDLPCVALISSFAQPESVYSSGIASNASPSETRSPLILIAEDNDANVITLSSYLNAKGYRLVIAQDGREAIALAQSEQPDLIVIDIQMPGLDGLNAIHQIRHIPALAQVPIIALTALVMTGDRERCLAAGANEYLSKPVELKQLTAVIQHLLSQQSQ